jgi:hypothetical protein
MPTCQKPSSKGDAVAGQPIAFADGNDDSTAISKFAENRAVDPCRTSRDDGGAPLKIEVRCGGCGRGYLVDEAKIPSGGGSCPVSRAAPRSS